MKVKTWPCLLLQEYNEASTGGKSIANQSYCEVGKSSKSHILEKLRSKDSRTCNELFTIESKHQGQGNIRFRFMFCPNPAVPCNIPDPSAGDL